MQGIKLVTFDATNTVLRFKVPPWQYYSVVARDHGYVVKEETLKAKMKESFRVMNVKHPNFGKCGLNWVNWWREVVRLTFHGTLPDNANVDDLATKLIEEFKTTNCWTVAEGGFEILDHLKSQGTTIGVISNFDPRLNEILHNVGLHKYFNFVITSYDIGYSKPDTRIFECALKALKNYTPPSKCLHIGDDLEKDYNGARNAGWNAFLITASKMGPYPAPNHVFYSLYDLFQAVNSNKILL